MKGIMVLGTSSDVGKSLIATAICRAFANNGFKVAPFKSQNMSNNSYVTVDGMEIGRAQGIQAEAAKTTATVWMNPILLKPRSDQHSEIVLCGKAIDTLTGRGYRESFYETGLTTIRNSLNKLAEDYEVLVSEGAGSPVEINLKERELVNMKVAEMADLPVILVADIDRGGVFASIIGTLELFTAEERARVKGLLINKFRGDPSLFEDGVKWLEDKTGIPVLGVLPYIENHMIDSEDSLSLPAFSSKKKSLLDIAVIKPPYISNYSDIEPFYYEPDAAIRWVSQLSEIGKPDAVILPGTKSTIRDLQHFKLSGIADWLIDFAKSGGHIIGICGGYQMLGLLLIDQEGTDTGSLSTHETGLGLIPANTYFQKEKNTVRASGFLHPMTSIKNENMIEGFEIHYGNTIVENEQHFLLLNNGQPEGYFANDGKIIGTYIHHIFHNDSWRAEWLNILRKAKGIPLQETVHISQLNDKKYDELAAKLVEHVDWETLVDITINWSTNHELA